MKKILMIGTGGTIASEMTAEGLAPEITPEQLLRAIPRIAQWCTVDCQQPYNLDSTNLQPEHWLGVARIIRANYDSYDGFVISHGTDTMAYTAAALSYLIQDSPKPIVLTGAQKPIWFDSTDSKRNLTDAFLYACRGCGGVQIVFNGKVILGTRARKTHTKSYQAFSSIKYPYLAVLQDEMLMQYITTHSRETPLFFDALDARVGLLKLIPGVPRELVAFMADRFDGLIIESFGVGGLPDYGDFEPILQKASEAGKLLVMTTQVPNEGSDLAVYHVGSHIKRSLRLLEAFDMTTEAVVAKLMWILGQTRDFAEAERLFYTPVAHDILLGQAQT
jgi:L-asparaginase